MHRKQERALLYFVVKIQAGANHDTSDKGEEGWGGKRSVLFRIRIDWLAVDYSFQYMMPICVYCSCRFILSCDPFRKCLLIE